jgi:hypothetical protein
MEPVNEPFGNTEKLEPVSNADLVLMQAIIANQKTTIREQSDRNRRLREELIYEKSRNETYSNGVKLLEHQLQSIQQERDKLVKGLQVMANSDDKWYVVITPMQEYAARLLEDIGVGEERT